MAAICERCFRIMIFVCVCAHTRVLRCHNELVFRNCFFFRSDFSLKDSFPSSFLLICPKQKCLLFESFICLLSRSFYFRCNFRFGSLLQTILTKYAFLFLIKIKLFIYRAETDITLTTTWLMVTLHKPNVAFSIIYFANAL